MIKTVIQKARFYLDEVTNDAKYSDQFITQNLLYPSMTDVLGLLNLNQDNPITIRFALNIVPGQEFYQLPPNCQEVWRLAIMDETGRICQDFYPRGEMNPAGPGWTIEGNVIGLRPFPENGQILHVWYIPSGDIMCHYGTGYLQGDTLHLAGTPTLGLVDPRPNAYAGAVLRILGSTWQERIIATHDARHKLVTVRVPFSEEFAESSSAETGVTGGTFSGSSDSSGAFTTSDWSSSGDYAQTVTYEIAPCAHSSLWEAISIKVALELGIARGVKADKMAALERRYRSAMKTIKDNLMNMQARAPGGIQKDTIDNPGNRYVFGG